MEQLWTLLYHVDKFLFLVINGAHNAVLDVLMHTLSLIAIWVPLYLFFFYLIRVRCGTRGLLWSLPVIALLVFCTDSGSVLLFKESVHRLRPCHTPHLQEYVRAIDGCGGLYGFVSSHAANHFGIAAFMTGVLRGAPRWGRWALLGWAGIIGYSRIYLGVHFPADVFVGALYGCVVGSIFVLLFRWIMDRDTHRS